MKILVATEDLTFSVSLSLAYKAAGHDVSAGLPELHLGLRDFDLIHFHWPEELTQWQVPPLSPLIERLFARLDVLAPATRLVCTVHNLLPHADRSAESWSYYNRFYHRMDHIGHFSQSSLDAVRARFPDIAAEKHFIHGMNDFADLQSLAQGRARARARLGLPDDAIVVGAIGQMRSLGELGLLAKALERATVPGLHVLRAFRPPAIGGIAERVRRKLLARSIGRRPGVRLDGYLENADLVAVCEASDMLVIPRMEDQLNSGVLPLAMTFGTGLVAPDAGVFRATLGTSMNELYPPGDASGMARAISRLAAKDGHAVRAGNRAIAADWGWSHGVARIMAAVSA